MNFELKSWIMLLSRKQLRNQLPIYSNKPTLNTKQSLKNKLKWKTSQMKFQESESTFWMQPNRMKFWSKNLNSWKMSKTKRIKKLRSSNLKSKIVITRSNKSNITLTNLTDNLETWTSQVKMKTQAQEKQRRTIFISALKRRIMKSKRRIRNGSLIKPN